MNSSYEPPLRDTTPDLSGSRKPATFSNDRATLTPSEIELLRQEAKRIDAEVLALLKADAETIRKDAKRTDAEVRALLDGDQSRAAPDDDR